MTETRQDEEKLASRTEGGDALKCMLEESMMLGMLISNRDFRGLLDEEENRCVVDGMNRLQGRIQDFLTTTALDMISVEDVLPLYQEVQQLTQNGDGL